MSAQQVIRVVARPQKITVRAPIQQLRVVGTGRRGPQGVPGIDGDKTFTFNQSSASDLWIIDHPLNKFPSVIAFDSTGRMLGVAPQWPSTSRVIIDFGGLAVAGTAELN